MPETQTEEAATEDLDLKSLILQLHQKIDDQAAEVATLKTRVKQQGDGLPKFQPMGGKQDYDTLFGGMVKGKPFERDGDHARAVTGTDSFPLSTGELARNPPAFEPGDLVELNMAATRPGCEKSWGELYEIACEKQRSRRKKLPSTVGRVRNIQYRRDNGVYKYRVVFPGLTGLNPDKDRGDGFDEDELLPYGMTG